MAILTTRETMGQPGQRTLLPFFGKDPRGSNLKSRLGEEGPTTTESAAVESDGSSDLSRYSANETQVNGVARKDVTNVGGTPTGRSRRHKPEPPDMDATVAAAGEIQESGRKKRRKTKGPSPIDRRVEDCAIQSVADTKTGSRDAPRERHDRADAATDMSPDCSGQSSNAVPGGSARGSPRLSPPRERVTMRLNPNGKLLDSPLHGTTGAEDDGSSSSNRKRRGNQKNPCKTSQRPFVVCMKYGRDDKSRQSFGTIIDEIMLGLRRNKNLKQCPQEGTPPTEPPKTIHPFFLSKPTQPKAAVSQQLQNPTETSGQDDGCKQTPVSAGNAIRQSTLMSSEKRDTSKRGRTINSAHTEIREPVWPPHGFVHIRDTSLPSATHTTPPSLSASYQRKKAKGSTVNIPQSESVLSIPHSLAARDNPPAHTSRAPLRRPEQVAIHGSKLRDVTVRQLSSSGGHGGDVLERPADNGRRKLSATNPALTSLVSSIPTARSSFERAECDNTPWVQKYAPKTAEEVLHLGPEAVMLRSWLQNHEVSAVKTGYAASELKSTKRTKGESGAKRKRQKRPKDLDSFIVSSSDDEPQMDELDGSMDEDDELAGGVTAPHKRSVVQRLGLQQDSKHGTNDKRAANAVLLSGPSGCGKTAAVYAVARELKFEVFEVNPGSRRSARDVIERVGDMTQNHLVHLLDQIDNSSAADPSVESTAPPEAQNTMKNFFKKKPTPTNSKPQRPPGPAAREEKHAEKPTRSQKQSLILLEEVDILFEEDKYFWSGVLALMGQSKRPIIMTCNDERLLSTDDLSLHAIFRFRPPPRNTAVDYMLLMAANEGHVLERKPVSDLYTALRCDLRATIMHLDFWCQMAVGSKKSSLDWLVNCPPLSSQGPGPDSPRAVSRGTYDHGMGWYNQDIAVGGQDALEKKIRMMTDCLDQWHLGNTDWHEAKKGENYPAVFSRLDSLTHETEIADMKSTLDSICSGDPNDPNKDTLDAAAPEMPEKERASFVEGYDLIQADPKPDFTGLSAEITATLSVLLEDCLEADSTLRDGQSVVSHILDTLASRQAFSMRSVDLQRTCEQFIEKCDSVLSSHGQRPMAFTHGVAVTVEDLAPYIRAIVAFDLRLERNRFELSGSLRRDNRGSKRIRTTRASRAALEGGDKATTRRERWFPGQVNTASILATGGRDWQDILLEQGSPEEAMPLSREDDDSSSSSGNGV